MAPLILVTPDLSLCSPQYVIKRLLLWRLYFGFWNCSATVISLNRQPVSYHSSGREESKQDSVSLVFVGFPVSVFQKAVGQHSDSFQW